MPIDRATARLNLVNLLQYQLLRQEEYGTLHLVLWYDIREQLNDLYLFEVYENFRSPDGAPVATFRFPGMGYLWLPGLYYVTACSRSFFEQAVREEDEDVARFRRQLAEGQAEILFPPPPFEDSLSKLLCPPM